MPLRHREIQIVKHRSERPLSDSTEKKMSAVRITDIDFRRAFDSVTRVKLFTRLRNYGIPGALANCVLLRS